MRARLRALAPASRAQASRDVVARLQTIITRLEVRHVALYAALSDEIDLTSLFNVLWSRHCVLWLPCIEGDTLSFVRVDADTVLKRSSLGTLEAQGGERVSVFEGDLICVPGLAFDASGHRLGRGKGYYDRALSQLSPTCVRLGVGFAFQVLPSVPVDAHDCSVQGIVTEKDLIRCDSSAVFG